MWASTRTRRLWKARQASPSADGLTRSKSFSPNRNRASRSFAWPGVDAPGSHHAGDSRQMDRGSDRRARIMREAATHFLQDGFERTSMDRIAASAKVSKQAIYEHFDDKEDLFDRVVRAGLSPGDDGTIIDSDDLRATLASYAESLFNAFVKPRNYGLFRANIVATRKFPQLAADLHDYRRSQSHKLAAYLERQVDEGRISPFEGDPVDLATRLGAMGVEGTRYFLGYPLPRKAPRTAQAWLAAKVFADGVGTEGISGAGVPDGYDPQPPFVAVLSGPPGKAQMRLPPERFAALCDAAIDEFLAHGFAGASLEPITTAAGIGRATIYRQFGGKAGLFAYVVAREIAAQWRDIAIPDGETPFDRMEALCRQVLDFHLMPRSLSMHYLLVQESDLFPELARTFYDMQVDRAGRPFAGILREAGMPTPGPALLRIFFTLASYGVRYVVSLRPVTTAEREMVSRQAASIILRGMACETLRETE
ncbi:MAG: TetR/AcrR family transcriptional regulator [Rhodocyclaceae bacterium]|nr:MAG: TetR/AcrR family transcriptional regulator [Rhodocyclaceae bacterium]